MDLEDTPNCSAPVLADISLVFVMAARVAPLKNSARDKGLEESRDMSDLCRTTQAVQLNDEFLQTLGVNDGVDLWFRLFDARI